MRTCAPATWITLAAILLASPLAAQEINAREQLLARGAPAEFADRVAELSARARAERLPTDPIADKALEGWAKRSRVPPDRVLVVLNALVADLRQGRAVAVSAGLGAPPDAVVAAAGEALGRGLTTDDVKAVIESAPTPDAAATGLSVASSLAAQGLERAAAVRAVRNVFGANRSPQDVLELPSAVAGLVARGVPMSEVARNILEGGDLPLPSAPGLGVGKGRPSGIPPGRAKEKPKGGKEKPPGS